MSMTKRNPQEEIEWLRARLREADGIIVTAGYKIDEDQRAWHSTAEHWHARATAFLIGGEMW